MTGFAVHSILTFSIVIPISVIVSFRSCMTSDSDVAVESCYYSLTLILVSMCSPGLVTSVFTFFVYVKVCFHIHDSFTDLLVSVVFFFFHFHNG